MPGFGKSKHRNKDKAQITQIHTLLDEAIRLQKAGQIDKAEALYLEVLSSGFEHEIILSNLGVIYKRTKRISEAIAIYKRATSLNPEFADAHANLGALLQEKGEYDNAHKSLCRAIEIDNYHALAYSNLGLTLQAKGEYRQAVEHASRAIDINPNLTSVHANLASILKDQGKLHQAAVAAQKAIQLDSSYIPAYMTLGLIQKELGNLDNALSTLLEAKRRKPEFPPTYIVMGTILQERGQLEEAIHATQKAIELDPANAVAYVNLGIMLQSNGLLTEAFLTTQKAIRLEPRNSMAHRSLGAICRDKGDLKTALIATSESIRLNPNDAVSYMNLGCIYGEICNHNQAEYYYKKALELDPNHSRTKVNLSQCQLLRHDYKNGWANYSNRKEKSIFNQNNKQFRGSNIAEIGLNHNMLIAGEQGIGDQILFASLLREAQQRCTRVFATVDERLLTLFRRSFFGNIEFYPENVNLPNLPVNCFSSMGDLGALFRQEKDDFKSHPVKYLTAEAQRTEAISKELRCRGDRRVIGLSWHSEGSNYFNKKKSIPIDDLALALVNLNAEYVNLQYGNCKDAITRAGAQHQLTIRDIGDLDVTNDIDGLASLISACDEVVTISNATAHLSGALGKTTHLLAPASPHFYWGLNEPTTVWYPSVKIYRQAEPGNWEAALNQLAKVLQD
jgi:tetratricopeptide (TPR) repeat protein/ADP-heptose:LPS heptosyltransferase